MNVTAIAIFSLLLTGWCLLFAYARRIRRNRSRHEAGWAEFARWHRDVDRDVDRRV